MIETRIDQVSLYQVELMKHAIGFARQRVKRGKYTLWRNYYCSYEDVDHWENLINLELAVKEIKGQHKFYFVTDKGMQLLASLLEIKIVEDKS